ncbi:hypothetical protein Hokovirus_3_226 [Hokovirus HKV1]|uniref:Uncharacterized protein n=1 Tax=Hokovirus HKV1 TaxID=1977638 RepID=A0A1V0SGX1_9VIRU|nr:hypothetical protein Hokovirus_3_226 [Hokovirus HKV1]
MFDKNHAKIGFFAIVVFLLLVILGIVAFHAYAFVTTKNGINVGAGGSFSVFGSNDNDNDNYNYNNIERPYY